MQSAKDFEGTYMEFSDKIYRFLYWQSRDPHLAEDLTSEVFVRAWKSREQFGGGSAQAWLYRIARNALTDHWRKAKPLSLEELEIEPSYDPEILAQLARDEDTQQLGLALEQLEEPGKSVVMLRFIENLSASAVASILELTEANVRVIQFRTLKQLKKLLKHHV